MNNNSDKRAACKCRFGQAYPSIPEGKFIIGCTEDNIWCNDHIARACEMYADKDGDDLAQGDLS